MAMGTSIEWDKEVEELGTRLYRYFAFRFSDQEASDLTQDTLIRLVEKVGAGIFQSNRGTLRMYAYGIAHFVAMEHRKVVARLPVCEEKEPQHPEDNNISDVLDIKRMRRSILKLSESEQQILNLMIDEDLSLVEIAQILSIPTGTVKSHVHRAKEKLFEILSFVRSNENERTGL